MFDVIIVGAGIQGLSTGRYLAKNGVETLLLDQFSVPHSNGSSHGKSRGIRHTYAELHYTQMVVDAIPEWRKLEQETDMTLLEKTGIISMCDEEEQNAMIKNLHLANLKHELLSGNQIEQRFSGLKACGMSGVYEPDAGVLRSDDCICAFKNSYLSAKGCMKQECVLDVHPVSPTLVEVRTDKNIYTCKSVVLTCGPWINDVLQPLQLHLPLKIAESWILYWKTKSPLSYSRQLNFPLTCVTKPNCLCYTSPALECPGYMKIGIHYGKDISHPSEKNHSPTMALLTEQSQLMDQLMDTVTKHYPDIIPKPASIETCLWTRTPDHEFILDTHPKYKNIVIGAGFSGHGFKMAPVVGSILGKLALGQSPDRSIHHFSLSRFKTSVTPRHSL